MIMAAYVILCAFSCEDLIDVQFNTSPRTTELDVPPLIAGDYFDVVETVKTDLKSEVEAEGALVTEVTSIKVHQVEVSIVEGAKNFNSFDLLEVSIQVGEDDAKLIAWKDPIPEDVDKFILEFTTDNLLEFLEKDEYKVLIEGKIGESTTNVIKLKVISIYEVSI